MKRKASIPELEARVQDNDRSFMTWMKSANRRAELAVQKNRAGNRFLSGYWKKSFQDTAGLSLVLDIGCGLGDHAQSVVQTNPEYARYVGMDYDPECVRLSRRRFGGLSSFQFQCMDYLKPPKLPRKFDYIVVSHVLNSLPLYSDLLSHIWERCTKGLIVLFDEPLVHRESDYVAIDEREGRIFTTYSLSKFQKFCDDVSPLWEGVAIHSDGGTETEHAFLLRQDESVPDFSDVYRFAESGATFPSTERLE